MKQTDSQLASGMVYCLFPRNHTSEGTLAAVIPDLERIRSLGTDMLYLMPVHPIGKERRKGRDGSPYAIADYDAIHPDLGSEADLKALVSAAHDLGMKVILDVVFNHTSPDSVLAKTHPEWFYHNEEGKPSSLEPSWSDIIDLDYTNPDLRKRQIETLCRWANIVDGFRCDVASRVPVDFWKEARKEVEKVHPGFFWLAESCHQPFIKFVRDKGRPAASDSQLYEAFDVCYDYDIIPFYEDWLKGEGSLSDWVREMERQEAMYPENFIKLRYLENHDMDRFMQYRKSEYEWKNMMAFLFMLKGLPMLYHGQEDGLAHRPDFFTQDVIPFHHDPEKAAFITLLASLHKGLKQQSPISFHVDGDGVQADRKEGTGLFLLKEGADSVKTTLPDGTYENTLNKKTIRIQDGLVRKEDLPAFIMSASAT